jgi:hypothetical protein
MICAGTVLGFSAILLPQLATEQELSEADKSWIASLSNIGQAPPFTSNVQPCSVSFFFTIFEIEFNTNVWYNQSQFCFCFL